MTINCIDEMNLYFHMKNHYRKLRSAKSKINATKDYSNLPSSRSEKLLRVFNSVERHERICPILQPQRRKKQNSSKAKSEPCMITSSIQHKVSRNQPNDIPQELQFMKKRGKKRNQILTRVEKNEVNTVIQTNKDPTDDIRNEKIADVLDEREKSISSRGDSIIAEYIDVCTNGCRTEREGLTYSRAEEHEYLQFLLRITEDIIINNYSKTEDIEKVFEHHIDVNKERLNMDKMLSQISDLSASLNISCDKYRASNEVTEKHVFEPLTEYLEQDIFKSCECSVKRVLTVAEKQTVANQHHSVEILYINKQDNLSIEPKDKLLPMSQSITSIDNFDENIKYPSEADIPQSHTAEHVDVFESEDCDKEKVITNKNGKEENYSTDSSITVIESVHDEYNGNSEIKRDKSDSSRKMIEEILPESAKTDRNKNSEKTLIPSENAVIENSQENLTNNFKYMIPKHDKKLKRQLTFVKSCSLTEENNNRFDTEPVPVIEHMSSVKQLTKNIEHKSTQIFIERKDECCDTTSDNLNEMDVSAGYVLVNGPIYILKEALSPEKRIVMLEEKHIDVDIAPVKEISSKIKNCNDILDEHLNLSDYSLLSQTDSSLNYNIHFSHLLHCDYDLTPQRDECSSKYHYLMVDAHTSISNVNIRDVESNENLLVKSESYLNTKNVSSENNNADQCPYEFSLGELPGSISDVDDRKSLSSLDEVHQNLLAKSEEYLLQPANLGVESIGGEVSMEKHLMETDTNKNYSILPFKTYPKLGDHSRSASESLHQIDMYEIKDGKQSEHSNTGLKRHRSLQ